MRPASTHDAIVIGAGPAGTSAALALARRGWAVAIVEKSACAARCAANISRRAISRCSSGWRSAMRGGPKPVPKSAGSASFPATPVSRRRCRA
ncbi:FAD-dependent oxidoreductase [Mesorhizobium sp. VK9D]|nr:FAD-dependent oxidoreductase [Mesorhizobium sp. VK9D]MDX8454539.1 FAD-dependent oxidoreductase [Mesorhizobium sp. VK9D]